MGTQQILKKLNQLAVKRDRQTANLHITEDEIHYWEVELEKLKKAK